MGGDHCVHSFIQTYKTERIVSSYSDRSRFRLTPFDGLSTKADDKWTWKWMIIKNIIIKLNRIRLRFLYSSSLSSTLSLFNLVDNINKANALLPSIEYYVSD